MKVKSETKQDNIYVDKIGEIAHITLFRDEIYIQEDGENESHYEYSWKELQIPYEDNLREIIEQDFEYWWGYENKKENNYDKRLEELEEIIDIMLGGLDE